MGKHRTPAGKVAKWMKAGKVKKKCCRSSSRCKRCPVLALKRAKAAFALKAVKHDDQDQPCCVGRPRALTCSGCSP
ncbi:MAG: hypothetical protein GEV28_03395 [Actinophytocola sp.]|nr:hypothetical protein [Actinophytocola sp.]